jgi:hypothetical protein
MEDSMETEDQKLKRLLPEAGKRGFDIIRAPEGDHEPGRGWRLVKVWERSRGIEIVVGGPADGMGATLDEIEAYLDTP